MCVCTFLFFFTWNSGLDQHSTAVVIKSSWTELYVVSACLCFAANHQWVIVDTNRPDFKEVKVQIKKWHKQLPDAMTIQPSLMSLFSHRITLQLVCFVFFCEGNIWSSFPHHEWTQVEQDYFSDCKRTKVLHTALHTQRRQTLSSYLYIFHALYSQKLMSFTLSVKIHLPAVSFPWPKASQCSLKSRQQSQCEQKGA